MRRPSYPTRICEIKGCTRPVEPRTNNRGQWESLSAHANRKTCSPAHALLLRQQNLTTARAKRTDEAKRCGRCNRYLNAHGGCRPCGLAPKTKRERFGIPTREERIDDLRKIHKELTEASGSTIYTAYVVGRLAELGATLEAAPA